MNGPAYALVVLCGALALAVWVDARFPQLTPNGLLEALLHLCVSVIVSRLLVSATLTIGQGSPSVMLVMVAAIIVPALLYCTIAAMWITKVAHRAMTSDP